MKAVLVDIVASNVRTDYEGYVAGDFLYRIHRTPENFHRAPAFLGRRGFLISDTLGKNDPISIAREYDAVTTLSGLGFAIGQGISTPYYSAAILQSEGLSKEHTSQLQQMILNTHPSLEFIGGWGYLSLSIQSMLHEGARTANVEREARKAALQKSQAL